MAVDETSGSKIVIPRTRYQAYCKKRAGRFSQSAQKTLGKIDQSTRYQVYCKKQAGSFFKIRAEDHGVDCSNTQRTITNEKKENGKNNKRQTKIKRKEKRF